MAMCTIDLPPRNSSKACNGPDKDFSFYYSSLTSPVSLFLIFLISVNETWVCFAISVAVSPLLSRSATEASLSFSLKIMATSIVIRLPYKEMILLSLLLYFSVAICVDFYVISWRQTTYSLTIDRSNII
jgi:hypothetical protein